MFRKYFLTLLCLVCVTGTCLMSQDMTPSTGPAPYVYNTVEPSVVFQDLALTSRVFSINATSISASQWRKYFAGTPGTSTVVGPVHPNFFGSGDQCGPTGSQVIYVIQQVSPYVLYSADTTTGAVTNLGAITGILPGHSSGGITSLAWDATTNTAYIASTNISQSQIYTFNLTTRVATPVGSPITNAPGIIAMMCNPAGSLFAIDLVNDNFWRINKSTGTATLVGALGYNANFGQDADFDPRDGKVYWAAIGTGSAQLRTIDTATGTSTLIGNLTGFGQGLATIVPAPAGPVAQAPDYIYYKFEDNPTATSTPNCAFPGVGTTPAPLTNVTLGTGGQFDSCLVGTGISNGGVQTGWNCNFGSGSWTISMWLQATTTTFGYIFGDAGSGSFRCFNNGAAGTNNITLRGTGITNVNVSGFASGPVVVHFVYDSAASNIKVYKNGVLDITVSQTPLNISLGSGFKVGGYSTSATFTGKMDEFRIYKRALSPAEITATWNLNIPCGIVTGITSNTNTIPDAFSLHQNYPNPFNPETQISFDMPVAGNVKLSVYDIQGREVATLVNEHMNAGIHAIRFDGSNLSSGVYFYKINSGDFTATKKMVLIK